LHAVELNERRLAAQSQVRPELERAQVRHSMACMDRQSLIFYPARITGFLIEGRNLHGFS
jgi:hypothetical protein